MRIFDRDAWNEILDALMKNKLRSLLTAFGIFWGMQMLMLLMGGGQGMQTMMAQIFAGFAKNAGFVAANTTSKAYQGFREGRMWVITQKDVELVKASVPQVDIVCGTNNKNGMQATFEMRKTGCTITGIVPEYQAVSDPRLRHGRMLNEVDVQRQRKVCVVGKRIVDELFPGRDNVLGEVIVVSGIPLTIVGQSGRSGNGINIGGNALSTIEIPLSTYQRTFGDGKRLELLAYTVKRGFKASDIQRDIARVLKRAHSIDPDDEQAVFLINTEAMFTMMDSTMQGISMLVWMIGLGTILSGTIGVSNIMMVTVRERTTEIGIRRAIGATPRAIMRQILSESMVLTLMAGMSGICLSVLILAAVDTIVRSQGQQFAGANFVIDFWTALGSALCIAFLGLMAGLMPALRAMRIRPVEAMRSDE